MQDGIPYKMFSRGNVKAHIFPDEANKNYIITICNSSPNLIDL